MNNILTNAKDAVERLSGCRIYRNTLPHGVDCFADIERWFGREGIKVVFDVGANVGQSAIAYLQEFSQAEIYSFEPVAATYRELATAARHSARIFAYQLGMGGEAGEAIIHVNPESTLSSIKDIRPEDHSETVRLETIAGFAKQHGLETIDFLKIDTEGYDLEVLSGAEPLLKRQNIHFIQAECEPWNRSKRFVDFSKLMGYIVPFGYRVFGIYDQRILPANGNSVCFWNVLFVCEKLAASA
jgi:FkbM family methyltransferase